MFGLDHPCPPLHWKIQFSFTISFKNCGVETLPRPPPPPPPPLNFQCISLGMELVWVWSMDIFCSNKIKIKVKSHLDRSRDGAVVTALASHQCGPGSIPGLVVICGLFVVCSHSCSERFFSRYLHPCNLNLRFVRCSSLDSPLNFTPVTLSSKTNISKFQFHLDYCQALYHEPLAQEIAQALSMLLKLKINYFYFTNSELCGMQQLRVFLLPYLTPSGSDGLEISGDEAILFLMLIANVYLAPVVQRADNSIQWINCTPMNPFFLLDSYLSAV